MGMFSADAATGPCRGAQADRTGRDRRVIGGLPEVQASVLRHTSLVAAGY